ncbi:MAG: SPASM domain-containing protein [Candidatus Aminicenantes bacterium]|nr:MAG: SPASM domain-containing protein [Candidatus Aminicenantes bacterium]
MQRKPFLDTPPALWQVELTNYCHYTCIGCPRPTSARAAGMMDFATFKACVQSVEHCQENIRPLGLHHFGESLLHPEIHTFIAFASDHHVPTQLSCNAEPLSARLAEALLRAGLDRITFSLDGTDSETVRQIRGSQADYSRAKQNIINFLNIKSRLNSTCEVRIQMIAYKVNSHQWEVFLKEWREYDIFAYIKKFDSWTLPGLKVLAADTMAVNCTFPYYFAVVLWDGRIVPCCHDYDGEVILGSIHDGLQTTWNSKPYRLFRQQFKDGTLPDSHMCRRCAWWPGISGKNRLR